MIDFNAMSDEELLKLLGREAEEELLQRYANLVRILARPLFLVGGDSEDLTQEGMIGLLSAVRTYSDIGGASFRTYAERCIKNRLISAVKKDGRAYNKALNDSVPIDDEVITQRGARELEDLIITREYTDELILSLNTRLSKLERAIMALYLEGKSYSAIAQELEIPEKSVDNAVQRVRKKLAR